MFERFSHSKRLSALEEAFEKLERDFRALEIEWTNTLDKLQSIAGRMSKRAALAQEREDAMMGTPPAERPSSRPGAPVPLATGSMLTPRQRELQQQILKRRAGG